MKRAKYQLLDDFNKSEITILWSVPVLFFIFFVFRILSHKYFLADSNEYLEIAKKINQFSIFSSDIDPEKLTKRPFCYPLFLALSFNLNIIFTLIVQSLIGILNVYLLFRILKKYHVEIKKSFIYFLILTPSIFIYSQLIMAEWLVMLLLHVLFWILIQPFSKNNFAYIQTITILLAFTKPIFYPFIYVNLIFFSVFLFKKKVFSIWLFFPIIILQLYVHFNESRTGYKHFSSIENTNLINYNLYYFKSATLSSQEADIWLRSVYNADFEHKNFAQKNIYLKAIATKEIKTTFFQYTKYHLFTAIRGIFDPGRFDLMTFVDQEDGKQGFLEILNGRKSIFDLFQSKFIWVYILLIPIFLLNLIKWFYFSKYLIYNKLNVLVYYFLVLGLYYILVSGPVNSSRYMMPFQGIIICFAIIEISRLKENNEDKIVSKRCNK